MPDGIGYELANGVLSERKSGLQASEIAGRITGLLGMFLRQHRLGRLYTADAGYQCFSHDHNNVLRPDVSFIRMGRLAGNKSPKGWGRIAPDLVVEMVSPNDIADEVEEKVNVWLGAGVGLAWVVYPGTRTVRVHRPRSSPQGRVSDLTDSGMLSGEDVLPGFSCAIAEVFDGAAS